MFPLYPHVFFLQDTEQWTFIKQNNVRGEGKNHRESLIFCPTPLAGESFTWRGKKWANFSVTHPNLWLVVIRSELAGYCPMSITTITNNIDRTRKHSIPLTISWPIFRLNGNWRDFVDWVNFVQSINYYYFYFIKVLWREINRDKCTDVLPPLLFKPPYTVHIYEMPAKGSIFKEDDRVLSMYEELLLYGQWSPPKNIYQSENGQQPPVVLHWDASPNLPPLCLQSSIH